MESSLHFDFAVIPGRLALRGEVGRMVPPSVKGLEESKGRE